MRFTFALDVEIVSTNSRSTSPTYRVKKVAVPASAISRVIGRGGSNINAIRGATGAHIEVEKQSKGQGDRIITIKWVDGTIVVDAFWKIVDYNWKLF